ncbi:DUF3450 domain-containing protein [Marinicella litoralis]|uniref:Uncharacterized protein DUF3450 n=1 Tax=Marinicella litoralis TaxID=644220 RepID=A0A4R6XX95_9GAMM|nr:DUF3450 domain-containing protein [Marinicella litoralis]TDR22807.1 uncharacterized protein DUF3450 [Marinicella litoralis]
MKLFYKTLLLCVFVSAGTAQTTVDNVIVAGEKRADAGTQAQKNIERVADQAADLLAEYKSVSKEVEGLKVYNGLIKKQLDNQLAEMQAINNSMQNISLIERQIVPLMIKMIDSLEQFIELDIPFLLEERTDRISNLRSMMERSDVAQSEKFRRVLESYEIEADYGRTIEAYKGTADVSGQIRDVNFFRVGRISLAYQTPDGNYSGAWDQGQNSYVELPSSEFKSHIKAGLKVAKKEVAPDLLVIPVQAAVEVK